MYLVFKYICEKYLVFKYILSMYLVFKYKKVFSAQLWCLVYKNRHCWQPCSCTFGQGAIFKGTDPLGHDFLFARNLHSMCKIEF